MKDDVTKAAGNKCATVFDEKAGCDVCGRFGAYPLGDRMLCPDCYQAKASCCPEFGADDLWAFKDEPGA